MTEQNDVSKILSDIMQEGLEEKYVASVILGANGWLVVQYGEHITVLKDELAAPHAAKLLECISSAL
ncbi:hypothetical protein [Photobacterium leiognathi]|nr:hypothetical protein [Photobacterium leiognathi]